MIRCPQCNFEFVLGDCPRCAGTDGKPQTARVEPPPVIVTQANKASRFGEAIDAAVEFIDLSKLAEAVQPVWSKLKGKHPTKLAMIAATVIWPPVTFLYAQWEWYSIRWAGHPAGDIGRFVGRGIFYEHWQLKAAADESFSSILIWSAGFYIMFMLACFVVYFATKSEPQTAQSSSSGS